jgi:hypothetical protein
MQKTKSMLIAIAGIALFFASTGWANVPAPPVNQDLGMVDASFNALTEADCRVCHTSGLPDRHHGLYDSVVPSISVVPYPEWNIPGDTPPQERYSCMSCHSDTFILERDCAACHNTSSPHHQTAAADAGDCVACHGDLVDNMDDGHYIPTYSPSLVTPTRSAGDGLPLNDRLNGAGACNYCHDDDGLGEPVILTNQELHHGTNLEDFGNRCDWCHDFAAPFEEQIRTCEGCHGPDSLHNIQADSPNVANVGTLVVGGEDAGYGHVGRDAGPDDSDCWGCHGFAMAFAPGSGPIIPAVYSSDSPVVDAGTDSEVTLSGASFTNVTGGTEYVSDVALTAGDGSSVTLTPDVVDLGALVVTIPGDTAPGNYKLRAVKADVASNPAAISITPKVAITKTSAAKSGNSIVITIRGSGFAGHAAGSGTSVTGRVTTGKGKNRSTTIVEAEIVSWSDTAIEADFGRRRPSQVTVSSVFGSATSEVAAKRRRRSK